MNGYRTRSVTSTSGFPFIKQCIRGQERDRTALRNQKLSGSIALFIEMLSGLFVNFSVEPLIFLLRWSILSIEK